LQNGWRRQENWGGQFLNPRAAFCSLDRGEAVYREGAHLTRDVGGTAGTDEFTNAAIAKL
jgi:hypothetical protein